MSGSWRPNRTAKYWPPLLWPSALCFSHSPGLLNQRPGGPASLGAGFLYHILSLTHLVSKLTDFLSSPSYIIVQHPLLLVGVTIAFIQPIHGQDYNSDIPQPDAPVIYIDAFPILTARPGRRSIYNTPTVPLQKGKTNGYPGYDTKQSDGEVPVMLELCGMQSTSSLPSLPGLQ